VNGLLLWLSLVFTTLAYFDLLWLTTLAYFGLLLWLTSLTDFD
jgi:hypothetical protein